MIDTIFLSNYIKIISAVSREKVTNRQRDELIFAFIILVRVIFDLLTLLTIYIE